MPAISIVIPTLNEAKELPETLRRAKSLDGLKEIIVVDAGSTDSTQDIAREAGCMTLECEPSRGRQLRLGAELAKGEIVLLLHADTWLPENAASIITETLAKPGVIAGAFYKRFRDHGALPGSRIRCWLLWKFANKFFGDQAIFVERTALEHAAGSRMFHLWKNSTSVSISAGTVSFPSPTLPFSPLPVNSARKAH